MTPADAEKFVLANTAPERPPHVPEIVLRLATEAHGLWLKTEEELAELGLPPPFWAFAWAGGQGLARFVLDNPAAVRGRRVFDFATGSGLVAVAAARAGAREVEASDTDPFAETALRLNACANGVAIRFTGRDVIGEDLDADVLLAGDVFYDRELAARLLPWFERLARQGTEILVGDPGRAYLPKARMEALATYAVPTTQALEDSESKRTTVWRFA